MAQLMHNPDVVLFPTFAQAEGWARQRARRGEGGLFSQAATTFSAWIADLWELHGDGRILVDALQRLVIMQHACDVGRPGSTAGFVELAAKCERSAAGVPAFEHAVVAAASGQPTGLTSREDELLRCIVRYRGLMAGLGLVEPGAAAAILARSATSVFVRPVRVLRVGGVPRSWIEQAFFDACAASGLEVSDDPRGEFACGGEREAAPAYADKPGSRRAAPLRFAFPSGRYAQPALVADVVRQIDGASSAIVACKDPMSMYRQIEGALAEAGVGGRVQASKPFAQTDFGRTYLTLARVVDDGPWSKGDLSDVVASPFAGFNRRRAREIDRDLRSDRLADRDDCLAWLRAESDTFSQLEELARDPEADILLGVFEQLAADAPGRDAAWRAEQAAAVKALRTCTGAARRVGACARTCAQVLGRAEVAVAFRGAADHSSSTHVLVTTQAIASQAGAGACDVLVLCDLTAEDYPVADKDDAAATLFGRLGLHSPETSLDAARRQLNLLLSVPTRDVVCMRPLNDWDGNETYPSAMLQDLIDADRASMRGEDGSLASAAIADGAMQRGEELLLANALARDTSAARPQAVRVARRGKGDVSGDDRALVTLPRRLRTGAALPGASPSPSQVELYLECPYKWFAQHRLGIVELDEQFGALERGSFAHAVLHDFYERFQQEGHVKVNVGNLEIARSLMRRVAEETARAQLLMRPGSGRYVPADQLEQRELRAVIDQLVSYLDFEASFLPGFHPQHLEYALCPEDGVNYAGCTLVGTVDRIDVDDAGNAVVIDYKGSVNVSHEIAGKDADDPGKVQTRMYAQAVRRHLGLNVVGALYVSYGKAHGCAGACDGRAIEAAHLPNARFDRCRCAAEGGCTSPEGDSYADLTFAAMLDATEDRIARAVAAMQAGDVSPSPSTADACLFCPVLDCPEKGR